MVELLIRAGADIDHAMLASGMSVNATTTTTGMTALHWAASYGHAAVVDILLRVVADVEARDAYGCTPLHWAAQYGHAAVVERLIRAGADIEARDAQGRSPRDMTSPEFRASFDRIVAETQAERVCATARVRKVRRPPRPRL